MNKARVFGELVEKLHEWMYFDDHQLIGKQGQ
jgi:hypothetical protein